MGGSQGTRGSSRLEGHILRDGQGKDWAKGFTAAHPGVNRILLALWCWYQLVVGLGLPDGQEQLGNTKRTKQRKKNWRRKHKRIKLLYQQSEESRKYIPCM